MGGAISLLTSAGSFIGGAKFWLIGLAVATAAAFGLGFWLATSQVEDKLISAQTEAAAIGMKVQKEFDDKQFATAQADFGKRYKLLEARKAKVQIITNRIETLVPKVAACTYSADAMKALNEVAE